MRLTLKESLEKLVCDGWFINQLKSNLKKYEVHLMDYDYEDLQRNLVRIASSKSRRLHEKTAAIIKELEQFTDAVKYMVGLKDGTILAKKD